MHHTTPIPMRNCPTCGATELLYGRLFIVYACGARRRFAASTATWILTDPCGSSGVDATELLRTEVEVSDVPAFERTYPLSHAEQGEAALERG